MDSALQLAAWYADSNPRFARACLRAMTPAEARRAAIALADITDMLLVVICVARGLGISALRGCSACEPGPEGDRSWALAKSILERAQDPRKLHDSAAADAAAGLAAVVAALMQAEHGKDAGQALLRLDRVIQTIGGGLPA